MKKIIFSFLISLIGLTVFSQDITGTWNGVLVVPGAQLRVDFHITKTDDGYTATMDSPDQNAYGIAVTSVTFKDSALTIKITNLDVLYEGVLKEDSLIKGTFTQMGKSFDMDLKKKAKE